MSRISLHEEHGVATVRMADEVGRNELSGPFVAELEAALAEASAAKVVLLCGLPTVWCGGASRGTLEGLMEGRLLATELLLPRCLLELPVPVVAALAGHAVGGGLALAAAADLCFAARESRYGANFMDLGFTPGMGSTRLLEHMFTPAVAHELLYTGELRRGADFTGGFNAVLPRARVEEHARSVALRIADKPRASLVLLKRTLALPRRRAFEAARTLESLMHDLSFHAPGLRARLEGAFHA